MLENIVELKSNKKFKENNRKNSKLFYVDNNTKMTNKIKTQIKWRVFNIAKCIRAKLEHNEQIHLTHETRDKKNSYLT